jgi:hypothetical protein
VEVADDGHAHAPLFERIDDVRHGSGRRVVIYRHSHHLGTGSRQIGGLADGRGHIGRVGVGHRLHNDGYVAADAYSTNIYNHGFSALKVCHPGSVYHAKKAAMAGGRPSVCGKARLKVVP